MWIISNHRYCLVWKCAAKKEYRPSILKKRDLVLFEALRGTSAYIYEIKIFLKSLQYFVARCMPSNQNAHNNRAQGMSPHVRMFFHGGTKNGKEESCEEKG